MHGPAAHLRHVAERLDRVADSLALSPDSLPQRLIATAEREWPSLGQRVQDLMDHPLPRRPRTSSWLSGGCSSEPWAAAATARRSRA